MSSKTYAAVVAQGRDDRRSGDEDYSRLPSPSRMLASDAAQRARVKKWIEVKHRRQEVNDGDSLMSIVTTGDEEPQPLDADDAVYRGRAPSRSRIGTIQSYRDALLSPKKTRPRSRSNGTSDEEGTKAPPPKRAKAHLVEYSSDDEYEVQTKRMRKDRGHAGVLHAKNRLRRRTPPDLEDSDDEMPSVTELFRDKRPTSPTRRAPKSDAVRRRLRRSDPRFVRDPQESLMDVEADEVDDDGNVVVESDDRHRDTGKLDDYDYADPFIDDSHLDDGDSSDSLLSAYSRKRRRRHAHRHSSNKTRRLKSPFAPKREQRSIGRSAKVLPLNSEVVEISSGSEDEVVKPPPSSRRRTSPKAIKTEPTTDVEEPKPRPKPRPVKRPSRIEERPTSPGVKLESLADRKGKGKAVDSGDVVKDEEVKERLHPDEQRELERAIEESRQAMQSSPTKAGESSQAGSSASPAQAPFTPPPSGGRLRMADLVASVSPSDPISPPSSIPEVHIEDLTTSRRCLSLPDQCEVWDTQLMDVILRKNYEGLPKLRRGTLRPWNDRPGKGNMLFSKWANWCPDMNGRIAYDALNFGKVGNTQNPSRCTPLDVLLRAVPQTTNRYNFYVNTTPPLPLIATSCVFLESSQLTSPSDKGLRQKYLIGNLHSYEWQRFGGYVCTASGYPTLHAQLARDCLQFSTRAARSQPAASDDTSGSPSPSGQRPTPSDMFRASSTANRVTADTFSLANDAIVPVYDARSFESLDFSTVLPRLADTLPIYTGGELPYGSFVMVGYTITIYRASSGNWTLGCNLLWAILIGSPND